jgi:uncharacterized membrane protein YfcA
MVAVVMCLTHGVRAMVWRSKVNWPIVGWFMMGVIPGALLGTYLFSIMPIKLLTMVLGGFLVFYSIWTFAKPSFAFKVKLWWFAPVGMTAGFFSAIVGGAGPVTAPFLLSFGLAGPAYAATAIATQLMSHTFKIIGYSATGVLSWSDGWLAVILALVIVPSIFFGKWLAEKLNPDVCKLIVLVMLFVVGIRFLLK